MPQVNSPGARSIEQNPLPGARMGYIQGPRVDPSATPASGGAAIGIVAAGLGEQILQDQQQMAAQARKQADTVAVMDASNKLTMATQDLLFNPEAGAMSVRGKDALGLPDTVGDKYKRTAADIDLTLSTPEQHAAFSALATHGYESTMEKVKSHASTEYQKYSDETFVSNQSLLVDAARLNADRPQDVADVLGQVEGSTTAYGRAHGWSADKIRDTIAASSSKVYSVVIEQLIASGNLEQAQQYMQKHQAEIQDPVKQKSLANQMEIGTTRMESQRAADNILSSIAPDTKLTDLLDSVRSMPNNTPQQAEVRDDTEKRVKEGFSVYRQQQADALSKNNAEVKASIDKKFIEAANAVQAAGKTHPALTPQQLVDRAVTPAMMEPFTPSQRDELYTYASKLVKGEKVETDFGLYQSLVSMASLPATQSDFAKIDLNQPKYLNSISKSDLDQLLDLKASILKGTKDKTDALLNDYRSAEGIISQTVFPIIKSLKASGGAANSAAAEEIQLSISRQVADYQRRQQLKTGKPATDDEIQGFVDGLVINGDPYSGWFGMNDNRRVYEMGPNDKMKVGGVELTKDQIVGITSALRSEGLPEDPKNIAARAIARGLGK